MLELKIQLFADGDEPEPEKDEPNLEEDYLAQIDDLKTKLDLAVDPKEYEKLKRQHKKLLDDYVNKRPAIVVKKETRPTKEIAKELSSIKDGNITNRAYIQKALEYRKSHIAEFGTDPFSDFSSKGSQEANADTNQVASVLEKLLEENPSPVDFRIKLNSVLRDDPQLLNMIKKRNNKRA